MATKQEFGYSGNTPTQGTTPRKYTKLVKKLKYTIDFLVVAGGGGAPASPNRGGAGAGGYRNSYGSEASGGGASSETSFTATQGY